MGVYTRLIAMSHPDRCGDAEVFRQLKEARDSHLKKIKGRGQPRKHMQVRGFVIVDRNKGNRFREFKTRKEAVKFAKGLVGTSDTAPTGDEAHLVIVGNAAAERQRKSRKKKKQFIHQPNRGMGRGYMTGAPHGLGEPTTGGYDTTKLDSVDAAHRSTRRNRPDGHGPDLDEQDETADVLDIDRLPAPWRDQLIEIEFQEASSLRSRECAINSSRRKRNVCCLRDGIKF